MLPQVTLPPSLAMLVEVFGSCFTVPTLATFRVLLAGLIAQTGRRTVCGMLLGAGVAEWMPHDRAHRFFSQAAWSIDQVGLALARLIVDRLVPAGVGLQVAVDDTLFRRRGKTVHHAFWTHDGSQPGNVTARGNRWVIVGLVVTLPVCRRPVCLPILFRLWAGKGSASPVELARTLVGLLARAFPDRSVHVAADAAYHGRPLRDLPDRITWTTRLARNRVALAVQRTVPFSMIVMSLVIVWYALAGHHPNDITDRRTRQPWYACKTEPSFEDMIAKLRRTIIAARFLPEHPGQATPEQINAVHLAWASAAA